MRISLFDRKELVLINRFRLLAALLFIFASVFQGHPAQAQIQEFSYTGPAFSFADCVALGDPRHYACQAGMLAGRLS